eukprot:799462-Pyramimonas_sp.AAC.1
MALAPSRIFHDAGREQWAISEHESTLYSRSRQARLTGGTKEGGGGGRRASAMAATVHRLGPPTDKLASGRTKGETTCKFVKQGKNFPEAGQGCPYNHKKSTTPAAPAQPGAGGDTRAAGGKHDCRGRNDMSG